MTCSRGRYDPWVLHSRRGPEIPREVSREVPRPVSSTNAPSPPAIAVAVAVPLVTEAATEAVRKVGIATGTGIRTGVGIDSPAVEVAGLPATSCGDSRAGLGGVGCCGGGAGG